MNGLTYGDMNPGHYFRWSIPYGGLYIKGIGGRFGLVDSVWYADSDDARPDDIKNRRVVRVNALGDDLAEINQVKWPV